MVPKRGDLVLCRPLRDVNQIGACHACGQPGKSFFQVNLEDFPHVEPAYYVGGMQFLCSFLVIPVGVNASGHFSDSSASGPSSHITYDVGSAQDSDVLAHGFQAPPYPHVLIHIESTGLVVAVAFGAIDEPFRFIVGAPVGPPQANSVERRCSRRRYN